VSANWSEKQLALHEGQLSFVGCLLFTSQCFLPDLPASQTPISPFALRSRHPLPRGTPILPHAPPKSAKGRRTVALIRTALEALERRRERQREESAMLVGLWEENGLVFPNRLGKPMDHDNIYHRDLKRVRERAGLPPPSAFTISGTPSPL